MMKKVTVVFFSLTALLFVQACSNTSPITKFDTPTSSANTNTTASTIFNKAHFKRKLITEDNTEKNTIDISTINGFHKKPRNNTNAWANNYITAFLDKTTGNITYQINSLIEYKDHDKHLYKEANYSLGPEYKTVEATILTHDISCLGSAYSGCIHTEHVVFSIDSTLIENIAASYTEGSQNKWRYKLSPKKGRSYSAYLFFAEIAALAEAASKKNSIPLDQ